MIELSTEFAKFYFGSDELREKYPYLVIILVIIYSLFVVLSFTSLVAKLKDVFKKESRLFKLIELQKKIADNDKRLADFTSLQIKDELFKESTGYFNCAITRLIVDFYISNNDRFTWREIKLIISKFQIKEGQLRLKPRTGIDKFLVSIGYFYYGLVSVISLVMMPFLVIFKIKLIILFIPLFAILLLSVWMMAVEGDKLRVYKKMLKEPCFKDEVINKAEVEE
jgi:hypothetical protein